jgi:hypothetical protein
MPDTRTDEQKAKDCKANLDYLKEIRQPFEENVNTLFRFVAHSRRQIDTKAKGEKTGQEIYDGTALSASKLLVDGMVGYSCSRNLRWFRYGIPTRYRLRSGVSKRFDEFPEVAAWLQECEERVYLALQYSNFYDVITEFIWDGVVPGTAHMIAEEEVGKGRIAFTVPHFRECYIAENQYGKVDTHYRVYSMTLKQLAEKFGRERMEAVDRNFKKDYDDNFYTEREIIHAVYPRSDYDYGRIDAKSKPIASLWVYCESKDKSALIDESGYDGMPVITWRWRKNNDEWYGRSPSWDALVDIAKGNQQGKTNLIAGHKMVDPPMVAPADMRGKVNSGPGGWSWYDGFSGKLDDMAPRPMITGIQLPYGIDQQERTDKAIRDHFAVDFFLALTMAAQDKVEMTATQVIEIMGEKAAILGTRVGMLQSEALDPIHDRVFDIEMRAGRLPPPPDILMEASNGRIQVQYLGPLAQAQIRLSKSRSITAGVALVGQVATIAPASIDIVDWDEVTRQSLDATGFPQGCLRSEEEVMAIRQSRAEAEQQQQQIEALPQVAKAMRFGGIKPDEGSPVDQMMNPQGAAS